MARLLQVTKSGYYAWKKRRQTGPSKRARAQRNLDAQVHAVHAAIHSLTWIRAFVDEKLVGFVHACWDGGAHAFVLDTIVDPEQQRRGIGRRLVRSLVNEVRAAGCEWLHVDYEPHLDAFYRDGCGIRRIDAGLLRLSS